MIEKNLSDLEESISKLKKYYGYYGIEHKWIRAARNLFNQSIDKDCYKLIRTVSVFEHKHNYIEYKSKGDKDKILSVKEYLDMTRPYLSDIKNDHKTWKFIWVKK